MTPRPRSTRCRSGTLPGVAALIRYDVEAPHRIRTRSAPLAAAEGRHSWHLADRIRQPCPRPAPPQSALDAWCRDQGDRVGDGSQRGGRGGESRSVHGHHRRRGGAERSRDRRRRDLLQSARSLRACLSGPRRERAALVEKPLVTRLDHFRDVLQRMDDRDLLLTVGLNRRYSPIVRQLQEALESEVDSVSYTITRPVPPGGSLVARPRRRGRPADQRGRALLRPVQSPRRADAGVGVRAVRSGVLPRIRGRCATTQPRSITATRLPTSRSTRAARPTTRRSGSRC